MYMRLQLQVGPMHESWLCKIGKNWYDSIIQHEFDTKLMNLGRGY